MLHYQPLISFLLSDSGTDYHQLENDQRSRSHIKGKVFKNVKMSPKKRAVLENVYRPMKMNFGEKSWCRDQEKKEEFRRPTQITPVKILPVTPVKISAAAGKARYVLFYCCLFP
jgi:hypothetical protein